MAPPPRPRRPFLWIALAGVAVAGSATGDAATPPPGGPLWISESPLDDTRRILIVVDSGSRRVAVYHVDVATGSLTLKSARDISWDLMLDEFNAQEPRPAALRNMLQAAGRPGESGR